jgi:hypothetical protein
MAKGVQFLVGLIVTALGAFWLQERLPAQCNPFAPLSLADPPGMRGYGLCR